MALKTNVYISDITNLTEARYYAGMEVSIIGFNATPGANTYITPTQFDAITSWLSGIEKAWQWHLPFSQELVKLVTETPCDFIETTQIPEKEDLKFITKPLLIRTKDLNGLQNMSPEVKATVYGIIWEDDSTTPSTFSSQLFIACSSSINADDFINKNPNTGIALKGIPESRPGWNDFDQMADLLESLETI